MSVDVAPLRDWFGYQLHVGVRVEVIQHRRFTAACNHRTNFTNPTPTGGYFRVFFSAGCKEQHFYAVESVKLMLFTSFLRKYPEIHINSHTDSKISNQLNKW